MKNRVSYEQKELQKMKKNIQDHMFERGAMPALP